MVQILLFGGAVLLGLYLLARGFLAVRPALLARALRRAGLVLLLALPVLMIATGRTGMALFLASMLLPLALRRGWLGWGGWAGGTGETAGRKHSTVETAWLRMTLDHASGDLDGTVLAGPFAGKRLGALGHEELAALRQAASGDPRSRSLLDAYLDRRFGAAARGAEDAAEPPPPKDGPMTVAEAREILGVAADADAAAIREAHRRLMRQVHPDKGGSTYLAARVNQARDLLLGKRR